MMIKVIGWTGVAATVLLALLLATTTPSEIGPLGILAVFFCIYILVWVGVMVTVWGSSRLFVYLTRPLHVRRPLKPLSLHRSYYLASVIALGPVILLGMQSIGGVDLYGVILVVLFSLIGGVYIVKRSG